MVFLQDLKVNLSNSLMVGLVTDERELQSLAVESWMWCMHFAFELFGLGFRGIQDPFLCGFQ